jgi:hypothetical protein
VYKRQDWQEASASDGGFDSAGELFQIQLPPAAGTSSANPLSVSDLDVRALTTFALSAGSSGSGASRPASSLSGAFAYPNPFKPASSTVNVITFSGLTTGAKVQIFTSAGEPVFDEDADPLNGQATWRAVNKEGQDVASGVYFYLITDTAGNKKEGKLAVIR